MRREQVTVFVKERGGLCNSFEFYVPRTEEAVVTEEVQVTTYVADPAKIKVRAPNRSRFSALLFLYFFLNGGRDGGGSKSSLCGGAHR